MSQDFLIWTDFHPILVGAGCLALGYVYGRHYRPVSAIPADVPPASDDLCCTQSQCQTYFEDLERPCKCCVSAPARLDAVVATGNGKKASNFTRSPYLVQDAAEGFEQSERSTKRDLANDMENLDAEPPGMRQLSCEPYFEKGYQVLEEEQFLQAKTAYKKQKVSKGQADMGNPVKNDEDDSAAAPWSRELLHKRIDYFNNVSETSATDESKKVRLFKKKSLSKGEFAFDSTSADSNPGGVDSGLVHIATLQQGDDNHSPNSPYRMSGGGCNMAFLGETHVDPKILQNAFEAPPVDGVDTQASGQNVVKQLSCDPSETQGDSQLEAVSLSVASCQLLHVSSTTNGSPEHYVTDRCKFRVETARDEGLKAELFDLVSETDCSKIKGCRRTARKGKPKSPTLLVKLLAFVSSWKRKGPTRKRVIKPRRSIIEWNL